MMHRGWKHGVTSGLHRGVFLGLMAGASSLTALRLQKAVRIYVTKWFLVSKLRFCLALTDFEQTNFAFVHKHFC